MINHSWLNGNKEQIAHVCDEILPLCVKSPKLTKAMNILKTDFFQDSLKNEDQVKGVLLALGYIQTTLELRGQI